MNSNNNVFENFENTVIVTINSTTELNYNSSADSHHTQDYKIVALLSFCTTYFWRSPNLIGTFKIQK